MEQFRVIIPDEKYTVLEFLQEDSPGVALINRALRTFEAKVVFGWHLSLMIDFEDIIENGMPSQQERNVLDEFEERFSSLLKGTDLEKPNALFLARITWNKTRELIWRIYEPEAANKLLETIIEQNQFSRTFDYRLECDKDWKLAEWHLAEHKK
ncbi:DUF695 domain-containing protein [Mucilaginibacter flavidus]|uniref:DUF695 domain-containing protein n=1 Tax=Mucilaginibacter flavidus TaxID=2949309 RepID=UPI002092D4D2|nr:DUF695 domain-containing protein [Mucilaginibacter flavidus]MCO5950038.1 DUF695 domain-containing protein [Mucilaginibacter flavidus]